MANITGTNGDDTLTGTSDRDIIKGLSGNDIIKSSAGGDLIDGGAGNDTVDYSIPDGVTNDPFYVVRLPNGSTDGFSTDEFLTVRRDRSFLGREDRLLNIETIIARVPPQGERNLNTIDIDAGVADVDLDLAKNRLIYSSPVYGTKTLGIKNFADVTINGSGKYRIKGDDRDNTLNISFFAGESTIIGSKGNDSLVAKTIDYSKIGNAVTVFMTAFITSRKGSSFLSYSENIEKGGVGTDRVGATTEKIIGANNKENTLDASSAFNNSNTEINLLKNYFKATDLGSIGIVGPQQIEIVNFVNALGTKNNDTIVGANKNGKLTGGGGNDRITGGSKNDRITGTDSTARGVGEVDTLTGGGGRDKFVLGDKNAAYYIGKGKDDYATITDFNLFQDSIDLGGFKDYSFASAGNNTIELYSGKDVNTRDLIAKIQLAGGISNRSTNSRSVMGADASLNAITSKIDILSGSSSTADV
jgi:RTX calcium-binding nonapeptide repeat (4 copies)